MASGSLRQYLSIAHSAKLAAPASSSSKGAAPAGAATTIDDPEKILYQYIPPGLLPPLVTPRSRLTYHSGRLDYFKNQKSFEAEVEKDAKTFRPMGEKIWSYARPAPGRSSGKGKGKQGSELLNEDSEDVVVFESYYVSCNFAPEHVLSGGLIDV